MKAVLITIGVFLLCFSLTNGVSSTWPQTTNALPPPTGGPARAGQCVARNITGKQFVADVLSDISWLVTDSQGNRGEALFEVSGAVPVVFLPLIVKSPPAPGIYGRVTFNRAPAPGVLLDLRFWNGSWSSAGTTTTDGSGNYVFSGVPGLSPGQLYYVRFGPNTTNSQYVSNWLGPDIRSYVAGGVVAGGDFDIANVALLSPASEARVSLPAMFTWHRRQLGNESYRWRLYDRPNEKPWVSGDLGDVDSFTLNELPQGFAPELVYEWYVEVWTGPDNYGVSHDSHKVIFSGGAAIKSEGELVQQVEIERNERSGAIPVREGAQP